MKKKMISFFAITIFTTVCSQVGIATADPKAALEIVSSSSGILIPRMTAIQVEGVPSPDIGELVFSLTDTGTIVNKKGFWYYDGTTWKPIATNNSVGVNIYNSDGNLSGNRIVKMAGYNLNIGPGKTFIDGNSGNVGVNTINPSQKLDVNGNMRVRTLTGGNVMSLSTGQLSDDKGYLKKFGDIRFSYLPTDHDGWYLLDGRSLSTLPAFAQNNAASLGITGNLPNASSAYIKQGSPGTLSGNGQVVLATANFPNYTISGSVSTRIHSHFFITPGYPNLKGSIVQDTASEQIRVLQYEGGSINGSTPANATFTTTSAGTHNHTITINTLGSSTPINLSPSYFSMNYFIYLGK